MTTGNFFDGIGAFSLAAKRTGVKTLWSVEKNPRCCQILRQHFQHEIIEDDIRNSGKHNLQLTDIATGGFPCTQTSVGAAIHGKREGLNGKDSGLWREYRRIIEEMGFRWVVAEQPSGIKTWEGKIKGDLEALGYRVSKLEYKATDFGYPHERKRFLFVANSNGKRLESTRREGSPSTTWYQRLTTSGGNWLQSAPGALRSDYGISDRVDRIKELGNALVPDIAEDIFNKIKAAECSH